LAEPDVVQEDDDDVGRSLRGADLEPRGRLRVARRELRDGDGIRVRDRQHAAVDLLALPAAAIAAAYTVPQTRLRRIKALKMRLLFEPVGRRILTQVHISNR
jgi:hypothetical protein